jgi:hypothetical protein
LGNFRGLPKILRCFFGNISDAKCSYQDYNPDFSEQDYYLRALTIEGCVRNFIADSIFEGKIGYRDKLAVILKVYQMLFNIPAFDIQDIIAKIDTIIRTEEIVIYGIKI